MGDRVALLGVVLEAHAVGHARASARLDEDSQPELRDSLLLKQVAELGQRGVGDRYQLGRRRRLVDHFLGHVSLLYPPVFAAMSRPRRFAFREIVGL